MASLQTSFHPFYNHTMQAHILAIHSEDQMGERGRQTMEETWLKYILLVDRDAEDAFVSEVLASAYTLGWVEPQIEVLTTENGYDYAEKTDGPVIAYLFEPLRESEAEHVEQLRNYLSRWGEQVRLKEVETVTAENESWKETFHEVQVGDWWIAPTWTPPEALAQARHVLWIDPGAAFGTGYHGTTQDILLLLQEWSPAGKRVLDIGAGSGILSLFCRQKRRPAAGLCGGSQPAERIPDPGKPGQQRPGGGCGGNRIG
jgi:ribosomal protein L11 methyltransferase